MSCNEALLDSASKTAKLSVTTTSNGHESLWSENRWTCPLQPCKYFTTSGKRYLTDHINRMHNCRPKSCEHGCDDTIVYHSATAYGDHRIKVHNRRWPARCTYPDCKQSNKWFNEGRTLRSHLRIKHGITDKEEQLAYLPPLQDHTRWQSRGCPIPRRKSRTTFPYRKALQDHLTAKYDMDVDGAKDLIREQAPMETYKPKPRLGITTTPQVHPEQKVPR